MPSPPRPRRKPPVSAAAGSEVAGGGYPIRITSRMTGIEPGTLRMWERRYGFPRPARTGGGSRLYSEGDVQALLLIARAIEEGYRAGDVVGRSLPELERLFSAPPTASRSGPASGTSPTVDSLITALLRDDISTLHADLRHVAVLLGPKRFVTDVAHPASIRVGELWEAGELEVRHEHLFSASLSTQLRMLLGAYEDRSSGPAVLLATLPGESHGLGLDMIALYLAVHGATPRLLGIDAPSDQIVKAARGYDVAAVGLSVMPSCDPVTTAEGVRVLLAELPRRIALWIGGGGARKLHLTDDGLSMVTSWPDLDAALARLRLGAP